MISRCLGYVGFDTFLYHDFALSRVRGLRHFSPASRSARGVCPRQGGVPEHILWMQSGHAQDVAARRYVQLNSPALLYRTYEAFGL